MRSGTSSIRSRSSSTGRSAGRAVRYTAPHPWAGERGRLTADVSCGLTSNYLARGWGMRPTTVSIGREHFEESPVTMTTDLASVDDLLMDPAWYAKNDWHPTFKRLRR